MIRACKARALGFVARSSASAFSAAFSAASSADSGNGRGRGGSTALGEGADVSDADSNSATDGFVDAAVLVCRSEDRVC